MWDRFYYYDLRFIDEYSGALRSNLLKIPKLKSEDLKTMLITSDCYCCWSVASVVLDSSVIPWTVYSQAPPSMRFSRRGYLSGLPCPPPGESSPPRDRARTGVSCVSCSAGRFFIAGPPGKPNLCLRTFIYENGPSWLSNTYTSNSKVSILWEISPNFENIFKYFLWITNIFLYLAALSSH